MTAPTQRSAPTDVGCLLKIGLYGVVAIGAAVYGIVSWLNPVPPGEAVRLPAYGFVAELPPGWRPTDIPNPTIGPSGGPAVRVLSASRPGKGSCDLALWQGPDAPLHEVLPGLLDGVVEQRGLDRRPTTEDVSLPSGPAWWAMVIPYADVYLLEGQGQRFYVLWCEGRNRYPDEWRLVAEAIELLPATG